MQNTRLFELVIVAGMKRPNSNPQTGRLEKKKEKRGEIWERVLGSLGRARRRITKERAETVAQPRWLGRRSASAGRRSRDFVAVAAAENGCFYGQFRLFPCISAVILVNKVLLRVPNINWTLPASLSLPTSVKV
jgi:hypothetical protein